MNALQASHRPYSVRSAKGTASILGNLPAAGSPALLAEALAEFATPGSTLVVGVTGSVASGKSTLSAAVASHLRSTLHVEVIATDGFLLPNDELAARGLSLRKGYPESYDLGLLSGVLQRSRWGAVHVPGYSHTTYDRAPDLDRTITPPDILLVEGLGFSINANQRSPAALLDLLVYVDAPEAMLEDWFVTRFLQHWRAAATDPRSFYARWKDLSDADATNFARQVWTGINLPNLREHIAPLKSQADIIVQKSPDHALNISLPALNA